MIHSLFCVRLNRFLPTSLGPSRSVGCEQMWHLLCPSRSCRCLVLFPAVPFPSALGIVTSFFQNLQNKQTNKQSHTYSSKAEPLGFHNWQVAWWGKGDINNQENGSLWWRRSLEWSWSQGPYILQLFSDPNCCLQVDSLVAFMVTLFSPY